MINVTAPPAAISCHWNVDVNPSHMRKYMSQEKIKFPAIITLDSKLKMRDSPSRTMDKKTGAMPRRNEGVYAR